MVLVFDQPQRPDDADELDAVIAVLVSEVTATAGASIRVDLPNICK